MLTPNRTAKPSDSKGFQRMFAPGRRTLGVVFPIEAFSGGGRHVVLRFLEAARSIGVNHVILNFKYGARNVGDVLEEIGKEILPQLAASQP